MPSFIYTGKTAGGQNINGRQEASNEQELAQLLRQQGVFLVSAAPSEETQKRSLVSQKILDRLRSISTVDKMMFARNLAVMVEAGLSLNQALRLLVDQIKNPRLATIIRRIEENVRQGKSFAEALKNFQNVFGYLFVNMVRVGETSGNLSKVLRLTAQQLKRDHDLQSKTKGAMIYPVIVIMTMIAVGMAMMIIVIPKLSQTFEEINVELPLATRLVMRTGNILAKNWFLMPLFFIGMLILWRLSKKIISLQQITHWLILRLPIFGKLSRKINATRFARVFSSMIDGGVPVVQSLKTTANTLSNIYFRRSLHNVAQRVQKGEDLSQCLKSYRSLFPLLVLQMTTVGEQTGNLSQILIRLADFYEEEITATTKNLSSIIEPILMLIIGGAVAIFAISIIQPIYSMMNSL